MERWFRLPEVVRVAANVLAWFGYAVVVLSLLTPESADRIAMFFLIACAMGAGVTIGVDHRVQTKYASIEELKAYRQALRTGELPADAALDKWQRWLRGSDLWIATASLLAGPFLLFGWMSSVYSQSAYRWVPAAAFTLVGVWGFVALCRTVARTKRLRAEINRRHRVALSRAAGTPPKETATTSLRRGDSNHRSRSACSAAP